MNTICTVLVISICRCLATIKSNKSNLKELKIKIMTKEELEQEIANKQLVLESLEATKVSVTASKELATSNTALDSSFIYLATSLNQTITMLDLSISKANSYISRIQKQIDSIEPEEATV